MRGAFGLCMDGGLGKYPGSNLVFLEDADLVVHEDDWMFPQGDNIPVTQYAPDDSLFIDIGAGCGVEIVDHIITVYVLDLGMLPGGIRPIDHTIILAVAAQYDRFRT